MIGVEGPPMFRADRRRRCASMPSDTGESLAALPFGKEEIVGGEVIRHSGL